MDISTIKRMSPEQYTDILCDLAYDDPDFVFNTFKGHANDVHVGLTDSELLRRAITENKRYTTNFKNKEVFEESIQDAIVFKAEDIADWIQSSFKDIDDKSKYYEFDFTLKLNDDEPIGKGYEINNNGVYNKDTSYIRVVLERDNSGESPMGFFIKTAYPDLTVTKDPGQKIDISDIESMKDISPIEKLYINSRDNKLNGLIQKTDDGHEMLCVTMKTDRGMIKAYYTEDDYRFKLKEKDGRVLKLKSADILAIDKRCSALLKLESSKRTYTHPEKNMENCR